MQTRRQLLTRLAATAALLAVAAPASAAVQPHDDAPATQAPSHMDRTLLAFAATIAPGANTADAAGALTDPAMPFARIAPVLVADLNGRARRIAGAPLHALDAEQRAAVVADGLSRPGLIGRLYTGAAYLVQIAAFGGIYDDDAGCPAIGFEGAYRFDGYASTTYADPHAWLGRSMTTNGNPP